MKAYRCIPNPAWEVAEFIVVDFMLDGDSKEHPTRVNFVNGRWQLVPRTIIETFEYEDEDEDEPPHTL